MRVLMNVWEWPPRHSGGLGVAAASLSGALARAGVDVLAHAWQGPPGGGRLELPGGGRLELRVSGPAGGSRPGSSSYAGSELEPAVRAYAAATVDLARAEPFDLVHAHDWLSFPAGIAARALTGRPLVAQVHSTELDRAGGDPARVRPSVARLEAAGLAAAERVVCVSGTSAAEVSRDHPVGGRCRVVPCAVEAPAGGAGRTPEGPPMVLFVGRMTYQKGPERLLAALPELLREAPATRLVLVGDGEGLGPLAWAARSAGLARSVAFPGWLPRPRVLELMARASVLVLPSRREPCGLVALEAAARGIPVVLDQCCGVRELLPGAEALDCGDPPALGRALGALLADPGAARARGERLAREARQATWARSAERMLAVYRELCP